MANWNGFFLPEHIEALRQDYLDSKRVAKPIVGEDELAEFNQRIHYAMEYGLPVKFTIWESGKVSEIIGRVHFVDPKRLNMADVVGVEICD